MSKMSAIKNKKSQKTATLAKHSSKDAATYDSRGRPRPTTIKRPNYKRLVPKKREVKTKKDLADLTTEWYAYLKHKGFKDIEFYDPRSGKGQNSDFFAKERLSCDLARIYSPQKEFFFNMCRNYLTHAPEGAFKTKQIKYCYELFTEGISYRNIAKKLKTKTNYWTPHSYFWVFEKLKPILLEMRRWNHEDKEGLLHPSQTDYYVEEVLLDEPDAYNE